MRTSVLLAALVACGPGNEPIDYAPAPLRELGIHQAPRYVARYLMPPLGLPLELAHPRLGQPAIHQVGDTIDVGWIAPGIAAETATISIDDAAVTSAVGDCDQDGICHLAITLPPLALGLHALCVMTAAAEDCSPAAIAIVDHYPDPATVVHVSDAHIGYDDAIAKFTDVVDAINALSPPADFAIFTGDAANDGWSDERSQFLTQLLRLQIPVYVITGNHDYDQGGIDGHLIDVGPELDFAVAFGELQLIGLSSGQDLDDGDHDTTISESSGPDPSQLDWLEQTLDGGAAPTVVFLHHPIYNGLFATVGPDARDRLKSLVTRDNVLAVLAGHTHVSAVFDRDGDSRGLSLDSEADVPASRWPLHYIAARATRGNGGFAVLHLGAGHVDYRWVGL